MASITNLYSIKPFKTQWRVHVRILKVWKQYLNGVETLEMVVVDDMNQTMHVSLKKEYIKKHENVLEEGLSKIITNFQVAHNGGKFRTTPHVYKIQFASTTSVRPAEDIDPNILGLKFVKFSDIHEGKLNPDFLIDVVGQIVSIWEVEILNVNKKQTKRLTMEIRDTENVRLNCVLWGPYASNLESLATNTTEAVFVVVLRFSKLRLYQGVWSVGNCYNCSTVLTNPDIPEVLAFKEKLPADGITISYTHPNQLTIVNSVSVRDDFFLHSPRRTISEIIAASEVGKCVTMATIMSIDTEFGWYYMSCKTCSKKVLPHDMDAMREKYPGRPFKKQLWKCGKCNTDVEEVIPAFMLTFRVMDNTGETKFLLFDKLAIEVVNQTASQLTQLVDEIQDPDVLPMSLSNICGKTYLFKVAIESSNIVFNSDTYKVMKIVTQSDLVKEFSEISVSQNTIEAKHEEHVLTSLTTEAPLLLEDDYEDVKTPSSKCKSNDSEEIGNDSGELSVASKKTKNDFKNGDDAKHTVLKPVKKEKPDG
ncbi:replication protein A 70 kDa DNA-binding subunit B-like [Eutrema salsugineum]|uniref:replication protein A 70 kDa DNA-binding subunit B-like n=1 Tax=Eutrema salsugineum TaxID=72664 RepID=UPI000CED3165|nr:replication protein A 70 kDa DNA-binding subunit B-like [Eutrema salsugineum]